MSNDNCEMREYMFLVEDYSSTGIVTETIEEDDNDDNDSVQAHGENPVLADLRDLVFKLRAHMDEELEPGFERAAEMIENLIRKHEGN